MRKIFLAIAVLSFAAACVIIAGQKRIRQPFSRSSVWKSNSQNDRVISGVAFSPDGEKLIFLVYDESGPYHATQTYLYSLRDKTVRRLPTNGDGWVSGFLWSSDSIHVGFNRSKSRGYYTNGRVFNIETNSIEEEFKIPLIRWSPDGSRQLFRDNYSETYYIKTAGGNDWLALPDEMKNQWLHWSGDGSSLLYVDQSHNIMQYSIGEKILTNIASFGNYTANMALLFPSRSTNFLYFVTSRPGEEFGLVVLRKLDLRTGEITTVLDTGLDPKEGSIRALFVALQDNPIYVLEYERDKPNKLMKLDPTTGKTEIMLGGEYSVRGYSMQGNVFALNPNDNNRILKLLYVDTGTIEKVFRTN